MSAQNPGRFDKGLRELRRPVRSDEIAIKRVMAAVKRQQSERLYRLASLVAAVTAVIMGGIGTWYFTSQPTGTRAIQPDDPAFVQFVYVSTEAEHVSLVGSFNDWDPNATPLQRNTERGIWSAEVPLPPGHHEYAFNVDGRWVPDTDAPLGASNEFGVANSVILVQ